MLRRSFETMMNDKKVTIVIIFALILGIVTLNKTLNPSLNKISVNEDNKAGSYLSPDGKKRVSIYFNGGLIFYTDMTFVGVLEDINTDFQKNLFIVGNTISDIDWVNNQEISVDGILIPIDEAYDFRID